MTEDNVYKHTHIEYLLFYSLVLRACGGPETKTLKTDLTGSFFGFCGYEVGL